MADESGTERTASDASPAYPYTLHDDAVTTAAAGPAEPAEPPGTAAAAGPRGVDPVGLLAGLAALAVAILAVTDTLDGIDGRWLLAGAAIVIGAAVLSATLGRRARHDR